MKKYVRPVVALWVASGLASTALAQAQDTLSLDQALRLSLERQPALTAYDRTAQAFEEAAVAAGQLPDFQLTAGLRNLPITGDEAFRFGGTMMTMKTIGIGRQQVRGSKREAASARLRAQGAVSEGEQDLLARRIQREVMLGWIAVVESQQKREVLEFLIDKLEARQQTIEANILSGGATPAAAIGVQAEIAAARAELLATRDAEAAGRAMLARWIGDAAQQPLARNSLPICRPAEKGQVLASLADHPLLGVASLQNRAAESAIQVARADRKPDWGWSFQYGQRSGFSDLLSLQVSIDLPLNRAKLQNRRVAEASELAAAARDRLEDVRRELIADFEQAWAQWSAAEVRYSTNLNQTLPALEAAENALLARVAGGQPGLNDVQAASERTTRTALDVVEQRAALARISADLSFYLEECAS